LKLRNKLERWNTEILVPEGDERWFSRWGFATVRPLRWGQHYDHETAQRSVRCTFLPAHHWSRHGLFDRNKSLWGSWMISDGFHTIYFAGDSAYGDHYKEIAAHFPSIDLALMPIAPCEPHNWLKATHMNAEQAVTATIDLEARSMIPMHWGVFNFGYDHPTAAVERVIKEWRQRGMPAEQLLLPKIGQAKIVSGVEVVQEAQFPSLEL
jgi:L-ascorbate metabolism protein UlaG (beta-lactamase superfamily)